MEELALDSEEFVVGLKTVRDVNAHYKIIDAAARRGEITRLETLFGRVQPQVGFDLEHWAVRAVAERIVEALALSGDADNAQAALRLAAQVQHLYLPSHAFLRPVAATVSRVASAHEPKTIEALLHKPSDMESKALLLHEAVIRGKVSSASKTARDFADELARAGHRLAALPLDLLDIEKGLPHYLRSYNSGSVSTAMPFGPLQDFVVPTLESTEAIAFEEITTPQRSHAMSTAVLGWHEESNGKFEARIFLLEKPLENWIETLSQLPLESLSGAAPTSCKNVLPNRVLEILFSAASIGGAYGGGAFAADGRLLAWRSCGALVSLAIDDSITQIAREAASCQWCEFEGGDWFEQVAWDIGIACWHPAHQEMAVLCATDTD